jgi:hypothetical protein
MTRESSFESLLHIIESAGYIVEVSRLSDGCYWVGAIDPAGRVWHVTGGMPLRELTTLSNLIGLQGTEGT